jgi:hypothetical protein
MRRPRAIECLAAVSLGLWALSARQLWRARQTPWLEAMREAGDEECPLFSVVVPACNEAEAIEPALRSLLASDYPRLEIVAVDDRSTDATGAILDKLAAEDSRLRPIHIRALPDGWLGKNHALSVGAAASSGDLILFTDADVLYQPDALRRSAALMIDTGFDHAAGAPHLILCGFWERLLVSYFAVLFTLHFRPWEVSDPASDAYIGVGAFNLVRRNAYEAIGGHEALRLEVADDVKLGKLLKRAGRRQMTVVTGELVRVRWVQGLRGFVNGLTKNMFAGLEYRWSSLLTVSGLLAATHIAPGPGLLWGTRASRLGFAGCLALMAVCAKPPPRPPALKPATEGLMPGPEYGLLYPLAGSLYLFTLWRSAVLAETRGGIEWRGTRYSLAELRRNTV